MKFDKAKMRALRRAQEISQQDMADKVGVSRATANAWESGAACPSVEQIGRIAECLGVDGVYLLHMDAEKRANSEN